MRQVSLFMLLCLAAQTPTMLNTTRGLRKIFQVLIPSFQAEQAVKRMEKGKSAHTCQYLECLPNRGSLPFSRVSALCLQGEKETGI